jgi:hypothetical protein
MVNPNNGEEFYVAKLWIGTPRKAFYLNIDFSHGDLILFTSFEINSASYILHEGMETDVIEISNRIFRVEISRPTKTLSSYNICEKCTGVLGVGKASFLWNIWPRASFTKTSIFLGSVHKFLTSDDYICNHIMIKCLDDFSPYMCSTKDIILKSYKRISDHQKEVEIFNSANTKQEVIFKLSSFGLSYFPTEIYNIIFNGHNLYREIPFIDLMFINDFHKNNSLKNNINTNLMTKNCPYNISMRIEDELMIYKPSKKNIVSRFKSWEGDEIIIGFPILSTFIIYYDNINNFIAIENTQNSLNFDSWVITLGFILVFIFVRSKRTSNNILFESYNINNTFYYSTNLFIQLLVIVLIIPIFASNHVKSLFSLNLTNKIVIIMNSIICGACVLTQIIFIIIAAYYRLCRKLIHMIHKTYLCLWNQWTHEFILATGLWLLLTETNPESLDNVFTFLIQLVIIWNCYKILFFLLYIDSLIEYDIKKYGKDSESFQILHRFSLLIALTLSLLLISTISWAFISPTFYEIISLCEIPTALFDITFLFLILFFYFISVQLRLSKRFIRDSIEIAKDIRKKKKQ